MSNAFERPPPPPPGQSDVVDDDVTEERARGLTPVLIAARCDDRDVAGACLGFGLLAQVVGRVRVFSVNNTLNTKYP